MHLVVFRVIQTIHLLRECVLALPKKQFNAFIQHVHPCELKGLFAFAEEHYPKRAIVVSQDS